MSKTNKGFLPKKSNNNELEDPNINDLTTIEPLENITPIENNFKTDIQIDFKNMNAIALKTLAQEKGLITEGEKKTKKELYEEIKHTMI